MAIRKRLSLVLLLASVLVLSASLAIAKDEAELKRCKHQCKQLKHVGKEDIEKCKKECEEFYKEKQEREGGSEEEDFHISEPPEKHLRKCQKACERQEGSKKEQCRQECQEKFGGHEEQGTHNKKKEKEEKEEEKSNPYVFGAEDFTATVETEHGRIDALKGFTKESNLLRGIENYRLAILEASPYTFVAPSHWDAEAVLFIINGRGTISMIHEDKTHSSNVESGDILRVPAGSPVYMINRDENEKLFIAKLLQPVNTPGQYEAFYEVGGEGHELIYTAFSPEVLEAALKTDRHRLGRLFGQQKGAFIKASREEIQVMSHHEEGGGIWPFGSEPRGPFNLFRRRPTQSNKFGELYEAHPKEFRQLKNLNTLVSFANITRGSMTAPFFNSEAIKIALVIKGEGRLEMACPHLSSKSGRDQEKSSPSYQKIGANLEPGTVFVVPAGHPFVTVASENNDLQILCFEVNAENNVRHPLAGIRNIVSKMEREAQQLAFGVPALEVKQIFENQDLEFFFPGPSKHQHQKDGWAFE